MKASELFRNIKNDMEALSMYKSTIEKKLADDPDSTSIGFIMTRYNYGNLIEILNTPGVDPALEVDDDKLKDFRLRIDHYLDTYAPGEADLKRYITSISTYLAFIARKPLHPPGLKFDNGAEIIQKGDLFYCGGKRIFIKDEGSLCKYCVCKSL